MVDHTTKQITQLYAETASNNGRSIKANHIKIKGFDNGVLGYIAKSGKIVRNNRPGKVKHKELLFESQILPFYIYIMKQ